MKTANKDWQNRAWELICYLIIFIFVFIAVKALFFVSDLFISFVIALLLNYLFSGPVSFVEKYVKNRAASILMIILFSLTAIISLGNFLFPKIIIQLKSLKENLPKITSNLEVLISKLNESITAINIELPPKVYELISNFSSNNLIEKLSAVISHINYNSFISLIASWVLDSVTIIAYIFLVAILTFYLLLDGEHIWRSFSEFFNSATKKHLNEIKRRIDAGVHRYITGQLQLASLTSMVMLFTYIFLQNKYSFLLGFAQMLEIVPIIGTWVAIIPCIIVVFLSSGPIKALIAFAVYLIYTQIIRDNIIAPRIMGSALGMHPILIILGVIIAAKMGGGIGILLCLPFLAAINGVYSYLRTFYK